MASSVNVIYVTAGSRYVRIQRFVSPASRAFIVHLYFSRLELTTQNAAYEVFEGAKKKDEDWNPEENGGFAVHGPSPSSASWSTADEQIRKRHLPRMHQQTPLPILRRR
jgi:hypothetical protein